jgi:hypothetical protein
MSFKLCCKIEIVCYGTNGSETKYSFRGGINEVEIRKSINDIIDTAFLKLPSLSKILENSKGIELKGNLPQSSIETGALFKYGDRISIYLGYNDDLKLEFKGFIKSVNYSVPTLIECIGYAKQLNKALTKSWRITSVKEVVEFITAGTDISISDFVYIQDIPLARFVINQKTGLQVLQDLKQNQRLTACFINDVLYVGLPQIPKTGTVKLRLGWNVVRDDKLKNKDLSNRPLMVVFICSGENQKKENRIIFKVGESGGDVITETIPNITSLEVLKSLAEQKFLQRKNPGLSGDLTCFMQPYCAPFYTAEIIDKKYAVRTGHYFISATLVKFGVNGGRRTISISSKLN